jgi:hypothetical protein
MAKLFYTLEEAAEKLRKSPDEVMAMARNGLLQDLQDKGETLFRRSAVDQLANEDGSGTFSLDNLEIGAGGSSLSELDELRLDDSTSGAPAPASRPAPEATDALSFGDELSLGDEGSLGADLGAGLSLGDDDLSLADDDDMRLPDSAPVMAASGADDSMALDDLMLADDEPAPAPAPKAAPQAAASSGGSAMGLADTSGESMMMDSPAARSGAGSRAGSAAGDSMAFSGDGGTLETVGGGSGLLDISSEESFFGAQMIEESMGGDDAVVLPEEAGELFGGEADGGEAAAPVTVGTATTMAFGAQALAEARDPKFSGFAAGALAVAAIALFGMGWAVTEISLGNYADVSRMIAEQWMIVLGGIAGGVLLAGGIGFGIGKAVG